jgi:hypothetical protein
MIKLKVTKKSIHIKTFPPWKINNAAILELSRLFNIKYNILINLGLSFNTKYKLIETEKLNPHINADDSLLKMRNERLYGYYLKIVRMYNMIKHHEYLRNVPFELKNILGTLKVRNLNQILPDLDKTTNDKYNYYKNIESQTNISNFLLYIISSTLMGIYNNFKKYNIDKKLTTYIINDILTSEKLVSEPDMVKFKISKIVDYDVYETMDVLDDDNYDDYKEDDKDINKTLADLGDSDAEDDFSNVDLDMEDDTNLENVGDF